jgi:hypothetical protein
VGILTADLIDLLVLVLDHILHVVVRDEVQDPVGGDVPRAWHAPVGAAVHRGHGALEHLRGQKQTGALAAELAVRLRRQDHPVEQLQEVTDVDVLLGHLDELELLRQEAPDERHAHAAQERARQLGIFGQDVTEASDGLGDLAQRGLGARQRLDQKARAVLERPALDAVQDLLVAQVGGGDLEGLVAQEEAVVHPLLLLGPVALQQIFGFGLLARAAHRPLCLVHAAPAEEVHHLARDAHVEVLIGLAQQVDGATPLAATGLRRSGRPRRAGRALEASPLQVDGDAVGDRVQQPNLLLEEGADVGRRHLLQVAHLHGTDRLAMHRNVGAQRPGRVDEVVGPKDGSLDLDPRLAHLGPLPAGRDGRQEVAYHVGQRLAHAMENLLDRVEAVELLGALAQRGEELLRRTALLGHGQARPNRDRGRPAPRG